MTKLGGLVSIRVKIADLVPTLFQKQWVWYPVSAFLDFATWGFAESKEPNPRILAAKGVPNLCFRQKAPQKQSSGYQSGVFAL